MKLRRLKLGMAALLTTVFTMAGAQAVFAAGTLDYSTSLKRMQDLSIMDTTVTDTTKYITRGDLVKSIVISEGKSTTASSLAGSTIFPDIDSSSSLSGFINEGVNLGTAVGINQSVVCGRADGNFHPNDNVTYGELCTIMVRMLGYTDSDVTGAWPKNYIQKAADLDLTTDITLNKSDKIKVGTEAVMFDRLFDSTMKKSSTSSTAGFFSDNFYNDTTVTGTQTEMVVLANSKTLSSLTEDQILADTGKTYTLKRGTRTPEVGGKYKMYVDGTTITKVSPKENSLEGYAVTGVAGSTITYTDDAKTSKTMILPEANAYYYQGKSVDYDTAKMALRDYSSIVISKDSNGENDYLVVADPVFSDKPLIYKNDYKAIDKLIDGKAYDYIYRSRDNSGEEFQPGDAISFYDDDVVYQVSDLWGRANFIYVYNKVIYGEIRAIVPNRFNPTSITISEDGSSTTTYTIGEYFDRNRLNVSDSTNLLNIGDTKQFTLGINGEILDVSE